VPSFEQFIISAANTEMTRHGLTRTEVARRSGISRPRISRILNGKEKASLATWDRIKAAIEKGPAK
jgi:transcriptional regulator with XRE-family HTH domain